MSADGPSPLSCFGPTVADYRRYRPRYPAATLDVGVERLGRTPELVVDVACGTGLLTLDVAGRGWRCVGIDPNAEMLSAAREEVPGPRWVRARAEATGLAAGAVDLVVCGQAFHWFDVPSAAAELDRVLAPDGVVVAVWNARGLGPGIGAEYEALLLEHCPRYAARSNARGSFVDRLCEQLAAHAVERSTLSAVHSLDLETLIGRARSSSYVAHGVRDLPELERALTGLFQRFATDGRVDFPYRTILLSWTARPVNR